MNLRKRLETAGTGLLGMLDPEHEWMPTGGYEVAHDLGRWWDAILRLEETIGFVIPAELEAASLRNLQRLTDNPDRLLANRKDTPWLEKGARLNPHDFRETLLAFGGLVRRRRSRWARAAALQLVGAMLHALQTDGSFDFTSFGLWGQLPHTADPSHTETKRDGWFDGTATSGRALEALVWLYETTGDGTVFELAARIAAHHLEASVNRDGSVREEIVVPENVGHCHSYHGTLRGLLLFGLATGQREYVDTVEATYRRAVRKRIVKESGWAPHDLGMLRFSNDHGDPVADPASAGDSAQLALWLALHAGCEDLFDDVERLVRARLLPTQLTPAEIERHPARDFPLRNVGAWCIHGLPHAGKGCTPDVHAAVTHSLCDVQQHILTRSTSGVRVNLHFDAEDEWVKTTAVRNGHQARLNVYVKRPDNVWLRVPGWAPEASVQVRVDGRELPVRRLGAFVHVPVEAVGGSSSIELCHDLPQRESEEQMPSGRRYRFTWRGDEIVGIGPQEDDPLPFYAVTSRPEASENR